MMSDMMLAFFCRLIKFCFLTVSTKVCLSKAAVVAYVFSVQYFKNASIVAYVDLRVKYFLIAAGVLVHIPKYHAEYLYVLEYL